MFFSFFSPFPQLRACLLFGFAAQGEIYVGGREREKIKKKRLSALLQEHLGDICARTQTTSDVCVGGRSVTGRRTSTRGVVHAQLHIMKAAIDSADHNNSQASHSVMEIPHLIETPFFLCGSYVVTSYTQFEPFDVPFEYHRWIRSLSPGILHFFFFPLSAEGKRTVNHA